MNEKRYGAETLSTVVTRAEQQCASLQVGFDHLQTNHEGVMLDRIHAARTDGTAAIVINAGAWTHTSVALRDALLAAEKPFIEIHVSVWRHCWSIGDATTFPTHRSDNLS